MFRSHLYASVLASLLVLAGCAGMGGAPVKYEGGVMTDGAGMTLYTFDKDAAGSGKSACTGACEKNWPPLRARADDQARGDWSIVAREDGSRQWAYKGKPLYLWIKDQKPGDKTGDGFNNSWRTVRQEPSSGGGMGMGY